VAISIGHASRFNWKMREETRRRRLAHATHMQTHERVGKSSMSTTYDRRSPETVCIPSWTSGDSFYRQVAIPFPFDSRA